MLGVAPENTAQSRVTLVPSTMQTEQPTSTLSSSSGKKGPVHPGRTGGGPVYV